MHDDLLDPGFAALIDAAGPAPSPFDWAALRDQTGGCRLPSCGCARDGEVPNCAREQYYAGLATMLLLDGTRLVVQARAVRHRSYKAGVKTPKRRSASERAQAEAARWGFAVKGVPATLRQAINTEVANRGWFCEGPREATVAQ